MKKTSKMMVGCLMFLLTISCSKDDAPATNNSNTSDTSASIIGNWEMVSFNYNGTNTTSYTGGSLVSSYEGVGKNINATMSVTEGPNKVKATGSYTVHLKTTTSGTVIEQDVPTSFNNEATWTKDGTKLTINTTESTITELTATTLKYKADQNEVTDLGGGMTSTVKITSYFTFKRK